jgi:putative peptide zinc metalloprotease protein
MFCQIGDPKRLEAMLVIDQADIDFIREGQEIEILLDAMPGKRLLSRIEDIAEVNMKESPKQLSNKFGGELATKTDESGREKPISTSYQARAWLDNKEGLMRLGMRGQAKIHAGWLTLGQRIWRFVNQTFRFRL